MLLLSNNILEYIVKELQLSDLNSPLLDNFNFAKKDITNDDDDNTNNKNNIYLINNYSEYIKNIPQKKLSNSQALKELILLLNHYQVKINIFYSNAFKLKIIMGLIKSNLYSRSLDFLYRSIQSEDNDNDDEIKDISFLFFERYSKSKDIYAMIKNYALTLEKKILFNIFSLERDIINSKAYLELLTLLLVFNIKSSILFLQRNIAKNPKIKLFYPTKSNLVVKDTIPINRIADIRYYCHRRYDPSLYKFNQNILTNSYVYNTENRRILVIHDSKNSIAVDTDLYKYLMTIFLTGNMDSNISINFLNIIFCHDLENTDTLNILENYKFSDIFVFCFSEEVIMNFHSQNIINKKLLDESTNLIIISEPSKVILLKNILKLRKNNYLFEIVHFESKLKNAMSPILTKEIKKLKLKELNNNNNKKSNVKINLSLWDSFYLVKMKSNDLFRVHEIGLLS